MRLMRPAIPDLAARVVRPFSVLLALTLTAPPAVLDGQTSVRPKRTPLMTGATTAERPLAGGDVHAYTIALRAGQYYRIVITQSAVDLVATIDGPGARQTASVDSSRLTVGSEVVELVALSSGAHVLTVHAHDADAPRGSYQVRVDALRPATSADRQRVQGLRVLEDADRLRGEGSRESIRLSFPEYERARSMFRANGDRQAEATALLRAGNAYFLLDDYRATEASYRQAADAFRALQDGRGEAEALSGLTRVQMNSQEALSLGERAFALVEALEDDGVLAGVLLDLGTAQAYSDARSKAIPTLERAVALLRERQDRRQLVLALRSLGEAVILIKGGKASFEYHAEAIRLAQALGDLRLEALATGTMGWAYESAGEFDKARASFERSLELSRQCGAPRSQARQLVSLATLLHNTADYKKSLANVQEALPLVRQAGDTDLEATILQTTAVLNGVLIGHEGQTVELYRTAIEIHSRNGNRGEEALTRLSLGQAYQDLGDLPAALEYKSRALEIYKELGDPREAWAQDALGYLYGARADYARAIEHFSLSLNINRKIGDRRREALALRNIAQYHWLLGDSTRALETYEQVMAFARTTKDIFLQKSALSRIAAIHSALGRFTQAEPEYLEVLAWGREAGSREVEIIGLLGVAGAHKGTGNYAAAVTAYEEALRAARQVRERSKEVDALNGLGETRAAAGQLDQSLESLGEALRLARESGLQASESVVLRNLMVVWRGASRPALAVFYGKQAVNLFQGMRANIVQLDPQTQRAFLRSKEQVYRELADLLIVQGRLPEAQQVLDFLKLEELRDYVRRDAQAAAATGRLDLTPAEVAWHKRYSEIQDRLAAIGRERGELVAVRVRTPEQITALDRLEADLRVAAQAHQKFLSSLAAEFGVGSESGERISHLREAQGLMADLREMGTGTVALHTLVGEQRYRVMLTTADVQKAAEFPIGAADLARKVLSFREALQNPQSDPRPLARELYDVLIGPIAKDLEQAGARMLMWSLDGVLRYVPIAALHDGTGYLVERYPTSVFTPASNARLKDLAVPWRHGLGVGVTKARAGFDPLPAVADELHGLIRDDRVPASTNGLLRGHLLMDEAFTATALRSELRSRPPVVHVATHFQFRPGNEADSFLLLGDGSRLTVAELRTTWGLFDGVDLLTLSACNTANGAGGETGKEIESFGALAQLNGAKAVVATLWPVADVSTRNLMEHFYRARSAGGGVAKSEALRLAQVALLRGKVGGEPANPGRGLKSLKVAAAPAGTRGARYAHPYYWAPFLLIGNWR